MATDEDALNELKQVSDVTMPHVIKQFLYFPSEQAAKRFGMALRNQGFDVNDSLGAIYGSWAVVATSEFVPSLDKISELRTRLGSIASELGGEYDGWEAEVWEKKDHAS